MLQQILKDLWVDPELLARLDDDQKQQLFCRMREEQVRRWKIWDDEQAKLEKEGKRAPPPRKNPKKEKKKVQFLTSNDGEPWVWVMGEHKDDKSIEQILEEEAREKAIMQAKKEAEELRKTIEAELLIDEDSWKPEPKISNNRPKVALDIYNSAEEIKESLNFKKQAPNNMSHTKHIITHFQPDKGREILQELKLNNKPNQGVAMRVAQWENRLMEERSTQIFQTLQKQKQELHEEAEEVSKKEEELWREQERKAKEAEQQIREIARRAREEHRRTSVLMDSTPPPSPEKKVAPAITTPKPILDANTSNYSTPNQTENSIDLRPPNKEAIYEWFHKSEVQRKAGIDPSTNKLAAWFHGLITRQDAEALLKNEQIGSFVVRVSEKIWGYAISLKEEDRCKHYLVDASNGHYQFPGANQLEHKTLGDLVSYHSWEPITVNGKEILKKPCPWQKPPEIFSSVLPSQKS
ncbi:SH2 domain-containing protein 4B-like [Neocloeon triangulifer]|uniref:SH2 domain-containing protein 4B-like n=1 Tax=Neocloeon triangulifer TaxID=2078957 RepID=UPI00286F423C|nr:SH2 domain-containing protein 4B-like [Neocloeon triangulifer]